uniref:Uncharacterized protein n=1 Tax=Trichuris muris TaxID=70415 RepID=A0A5S6R410_TRIMR
MRKESYYLIWQNTFAGPVSRKRRKHGRPVDGNRKAPGGRINQRRVNMEMKMAYTVESAGLQPFKRWFGLAAPSGTMINLSTPRRGEAGDWLLRLRTLQRLRSMPDSQDVRERQATTDFGLREHGSTDRRQRAARRQRVGLRSRKEEWTKQGKEYSLGNPTIQDARGGACASNVDTP